MTGQVERRIMLLSCSTVHGVGGYLDYAAEFIKNFLNKSKVRNILFVPYALRKHDEYAAKVQTKFEEWGYGFSSIHKSLDPVSSVKQAEAIFIGGGNTFQLLKALYDNDLIGPIRQRVLQEGMPYIGSSAGSNVATATINTTNDMPIVYPPSFDALQLVPFNINPHYIDIDPHSKHMGETREDRINQFHEIPDAAKVVGLREGNILHIEGNAITLLGMHNARVFLPGQEAKDHDVGTDLSFLL